MCIVLSSSVIGSTLRKRYSQHFYQLFSVFDSRIFENNLPFQSYGVIYLPSYDNNYCAIATTHGSSFDGISFAGYLDAMVHLKLPRMLVRVSTDYGRYFPYFS